MVELVVELYGNRIGALIGTWRTFDFVIDPSAVRHYGLDSRVLSYAIPLTPVPVRTGRDRRRAFFRELLPEGAMLTRLAQDAGVAEFDTVGMLRAYGRDIAGALQIWDPNQPGEPRTPRMQSVDAAGVADLLRHVRDYPLANRGDGGKTSLAGVQDKIVLAFERGGWHRVLDGWPSTHILKPVSSDQPTSIYDEEYGARLARRCALADFGSSIETFEDTDALVIARYDRAPGAPGGRIHQEDFSQILGAEGNQKYQRVGGKVSAARVAEVLRGLADDSLDRFFRLVVFSAAIGNLDLHTKNVSLLHRVDTTMTLAPAYDVVPQAHLPNDGEMALAVAGEYRHAHLTREHLIAEGRACGAADPERTVTTTLEHVRELTAVEDPHPRAWHGLQSDIAQFTANLLDGEPAGAAASRQ